MFATHQPIIAEHALTPEGFNDVVLFVLLTIQEPLARTPEFMRRVKSGDTAPLWGHKPQSWQWWQSEGGAVFNTLELCNDRDKRLAMLASCPGLGLAKAGFILQLVRGESGCLDTHNLVRWGIPANAAVASRATNWAKRVAKARAYNQIVERQGGTEHLWNDWCCYVAANESRSKAGKTGFEVSGLHVAALGPVPF